MALKSAWTPEKVALLRREYSTTPDRAALATRLGCSPNAMALKARACGLSRPRIKLWTPKLDTVVRRMRGEGRTHAEVAARLGVTLSAAKNRGRKLRVLTRVGYSAEEDAKLREMYWAHSASEMASAIGRPVEGVQGRLELLGLCGKGRRFPSAVLRKVKALNRAGKCDREITEAMPGTFAPGPTGYRQVAYLRRRHGMPYHRDTDARRRSIEGQRKTLGTRTMHDLRQLGWDKCATGYGLPPGLRKRAIQILIALLDLNRPATRREIAERIGIKTCSSKGPIVKGDGQHGAYMSQLAAMGLVCCVHRHDKGRRQRGRLANLYMLTLKAAELFANAQRRGDTP